MAFDAVSNPTDRIQRGGGKIQVNSDGSITVTPASGQAAQANNRLGVAIAPAIRLHVAGPGGAQFADRPGVRLEHTGAGARKWDVFIDESGQLTFSDETAGAGRWAISTSGHLTPSGDNTTDLGAAAKRVRDVFAGRNTVLGTGALATTATDGFLYLTSMAGTPTGTPTAHTGRVPIVYDTTNDKLKVYSGSWKDIGGAGGGTVTDVHSSIMLLMGA